MSHWLDKANPPHDYLESRDPEGLNRNLYKRVWCELGGPHQLDQFRPLPDEYWTLSMCLAFPFEWWTDWFLDEKDPDDLRWWPQLAALAALHRSEVRSRQIWPDIAFGDLLQILTRLANSLDSAQADLITLRHSRYVQHAFVEHDQNRRALIEGVLYALEEKWGEITNSNKIAIFPELDLRKFSEAVNVEMNYVGTLAATDFKRGSERVPGLNSLVLRAGCIWLARYGTKPSAERVARNDGETDPPFVRFIIDVCTLAGSFKPTRLQVMGAIRNAKKADAW